MGTISLIQGKPSKCQRLIHRNSFFPSAETEETGRMRRERCRYKEGDGHVGWLVS